LSRGMFVCTCQVFQDIYCDISMGIPLSPEGGTIVPRTSACPSAIVPPSGVRGIVDGMKNIALIFMKNLISFDLFSQKIGGDKLEKAFGIDQQVADFSIGVQDATEDDVCVND